MSDMKLEDMTDEQLVEARTITSCVEADDGGWDVVLSCGHEATFVIQPHSMELPGCAQCINLLVDRRRAKAMVRLWVNDDDYGTMTEAAARAYIEKNRQICPAEVCRFEPVADDAPTFLEQRKCRD